MTAVTEWGGAVDEGKAAMTKPSEVVNSQGIAPSRIFNNAAQWTSRRCGHASTFVAACIVIVVWAVTGPFFHYSDTWQLIINTGTTIVTFLMVFLIQNTQNRDSAALHLKLDELIRVSNTARNKLLDLENLTEDELDKLKDSFTKLADGRARRGLLLQTAGDDNAVEDDVEEGKETAPADAIERS